MTTTVATPALAPRERQVLEGLADGSTLTAVALDLKIREGTATGASAGTAANFWRTCKPGTEPTPSRARGNTSS